MRMREVTNSKKKTNISQYDSKPGMKEMRKKSHVSKCLFNKTINNICFKLWNEKDWETIPTFKICER